MKRRIATFEAFTYNESATNENKVLIFDEDQFTDFIKQLSLHDVQVNWDEVEESSWDKSVRNGKKFALITTGDTKDGRELIGAVLDQNGYTVQALYNDNSVCPLDIADNYVQAMHSFTTESVSEKETCGACGCDCDVCECEECDCGTNDWKSFETDSDEVEKHYEKKSTSYKKSGLKHPEKADLNKDKKISGYEKARGKAIQKSVQSEKEEKGLTAKQKKLPEGLRKAIEKRMKKK